MGTRGLKIVRFRGRYFVYRNQYDSYPEGLGKKLVDKIPSDPEQYKVWLQKERAIYAQVTADLDTKVLTVTEEKIIADLKRGAPAVTGNWQSGTYSAKSDTLQPYELPDDRLEGLPTIFCGQSINLWVEWVYILDLDREWFSVSSQIEKLHFRMNSIPRHDFINYFKRKQGEEDDDENMNNDETRGKSAYSKHEYFGAADSDNEGDNKGSAKKLTIENGADNELRQYRAKYQSYNRSTIQAKSRIDKSSKHTNNQILSVVMFEKLMSPSFLPLNDYIHSWSHKDSAFRELAFAILAFAAGQFRIEESQRLEGQKRNGYLVDRTGDKAELLPVFGSGCHNPGEEPGSAPQETIYWFENVLVSLVPDSILEDDVEAGIAKAVEFGLETGSCDFYAVLFSLLHVVMLHVTVEDGVTTVKRTSIREIATLGEATFTESDKLEAICARQAEFISLINFFNAAAQRYVAPFGQGRFPTEIYTKILGFVDDDSTYKACAKVSRLFRAICPGKIMFGKNLTVIKLSFGGQSQGERWMFHFPNGKVEGVVEIGSPLEPIRRQSRGRHWNPIIGTVRPSIITGVEIWFTTQKEKQSDGERSGSFNGNWGPFNSNACTVQVMWDLPEDVTARQIEELWAYYLQHFFHSVEKSQYLYTSPYTYACLLIPHYHEFCISCYNGNLWVCTRRPKDGNTPEQRDETLTYVTSRFQEHSQDKPKSDLRDGEPVIVAFGLDMTLYYWRKSGDDEEGYLEPHMHFKDFSKDEARLELETKILIPLLKEWQERLNCDERDSGD